jgi:transcriptional regulator with XRE-family HTH domain
MQDNNKKYLKLTAMHVRIARSAMNISQKELSGHTEISVSSIARLEQSEDYFQKTTKIIKRSLFEFYVKEDVEFIFSKDNMSEGILYKKNNSTST